jgi:hypothetical protein
MAGQQANNAPRYYLPWRELPTGHPKPAGFAPGVPLYSAPGAFFVR